MRTSLITAAVDKETKEEKLQAMNLNIYLILKTYGQLFEIFNSLYINSPVKPIGLVYCSNNQVQKILQS